MASKQREISVSEFFAKNRHLLGFDNPAKALLTTVKEAVDNSLDACEEAQILPEIHVEIEQLAEERFRVAVEDNGPGIVRAQIPKIFGKLLYGSKFHTFRQARGQQGIGISAAGMYGLLTTGQPMKIFSRIGSNRPAYAFELTIDTRTNQPNIRSEEQFEWDKEHGTRVEMILEATYKKGRHSVDGYLRQVAISNPHLELIYNPPSGAENGEPVHFVRVTDEIPPQPKEILPHPYGVELGVLIQLLSESKLQNLSSFLQRQFSRVTLRVASLILETAEIRGNTRPNRLKHQDAEKLHAAMNTVKIMVPPTNCLSPIGEKQLMESLAQEIEADFVTAVTRPPAVYRGIPFQIEVGFAFGGNLNAEDLISLYRYANRVPLLYQQSACAITKSVLGVDWKKYRLSQARGALPSGPLIVVCHMASAWVPFTSESKESIAHYPEILKEIRLALQEAGRRLASHIGRRRKEKEEAQKRSYIQKYIPHIGIALQSILSLKDAEREKTVDLLSSILEKSRKM
ncbi:MAG: DNA topoisomerase VI subunit B [Candidatus Eisenbacteria bacterium]|uniref:Type 2 DNA topoisomerase 6 subunit B n=1 Tax=Eiseniibacteriota bacterium TaxID=2212470 RepID=A0A948W3C1_UNCEI|nr:DNA topoisomerase VI subunit B [Candidatus Eisenbacteria bacterium]MBU1950969.1 DNA topoisomerase VI subunit B [Candidatus Eisenbacteria bacterium]MBU2690922.1 DNA topoisomerase VI subunit B [Candidatus Eisenbacteria bacterium]